ncbi:uncharacterized protein [Miscanthus floridulus]|uniref:uncharacterized protein isoform X4 n=1 Tax=Miscanthus floridulus TaxID=154761 RepID=UPI0034576FDA
MGQWRLLTHHLTTAGIACHVHGGIPSHGTRRSGSTHRHPWDGSPPPACSTGSCQFVSVSVLAARWTCSTHAFAGHSSTAGLFCLLRPSCRSDGLATMNICIKQSCSHLFRKTSLSVRRLILLPPPALH